MTDAEAVAGLEPVLWVVPRFSANNDPQVSGLPGGGDRLLEKPGADSQTKAGRFDGERTEGQDFMLGITVHDLCF